MTAYQITCTIVADYDTFTYGVYTDRDEAMALLKEIETHFKNSDIRAYAEFHEIQLNTPLVDVFSL